MPDVWPSPRLLQACASISKLQNPKPYGTQVKGTETIIAACIACGVPRLVYTSTVNTVFCGRWVYVGGLSPARSCLKPRMSLRLVYTSAVDTVFCGRWV